MINTGEIGVWCEDGDVAVVIHYDPHFVPGPGQTYLDAPLIDGPRGYCLDIRNTSGRKASMIVTYPGGQLVASIGKGDPVTTGPAAGRSRTLAQILQLGLSTRGQVPGITVQC